MRSIIDECYSTAQGILEENVDKLHAMADALMLYETIDADQINDIMEGRTPREPADWGGSDGGPQAGARKATTAEDDDEAASPIGGPAGEH